MDFSVHCAGQLFNGKMHNYFVVILWTVNSIVSILAIYFDFEHRLLRLNLIALWCFLLDAIFF